MRSNSVLRRKSSSGLSGWTSPAVFGLACWLIFPSAPAHGDLADLLTGFDGAEQWRMVLTDSPAGSIHQASLAFPGLKNAVSGNAGLELPDGRKIALVDEKKSSDPRPDEDRVNRAAKKGRIVTVERMQPPKAFSAGSVLQRSSGLTLPLDARDGLARFAKAGKSEKPVELAAFYFRKKDEPKPEDDLMPMIASLINNNQADVLATAYAPAAQDFAKESPFDAILTEKPSAGRFIPPIGFDDHAWAATPLPPASFSAREQQCLASGIYFEARGESARGQAAVAQVILNRVRNPAYPDTICDVVYQNEDWRNRCQFSFACDNIKDRIRSEYHWKMAREVAMAVTAGKIWLSEVGSATHYHAVYVRPDWARTMKKVGRIGLHVFYRTYGGGWS
ncbi:Cell wall hydrolyses involved in spore germination [Neorhizobium galegae bv. officinalis]|uniref:Cell wall hydrolyses involved in spore germination n=1 Tax=Neorhizobium galegae bv. officinalis TaxID=323656 RepID=A0A0T7F985_NEOGA|nr:cell wall hydrolase [Neorhizobium galegae]CDZ31499.1 Cell wall hydrolyses involved in spore germination [Neorhizobium galegae bv. officinalis]